MGLGWGYGCLRVVWGEFRVVLMEGLRLVLVPWPCVHVRDVHPNSHASNKLPESRANG